MSFPLRAALLLTLVAVAGAAASARLAPDQAGARQLCTVPDRPAHLPRLTARLQAHQPVRLVVLGSSSTAGTGASQPDLGYVAQLTQRLRADWGAGQVEVINRGVGGNTLADEYARRERDVYTAQPDLVIVQAGTNDGLRGVTPDRFARQLKTFITELKARQLDVLLIDNQWLTDRPGLDNYGQVVEAMHRVAQEEGVGVVSRFELGQQLVSQGLPATEQLAADGLHPNDFMHWCTAQAVAGVLDASVETSGD